MLIETEKNIFTGLPAFARPCVVVHYHEIGLKGKNRSSFENRLRRNILRALSDTTVGSVQRFFGRQVVFFPKEIDWRAVRARLRTVFGIANFSPAIFTEQNVEEITAAALSLMSGLRFTSFRVTTKRGQKDFPINSQEMNIRVGSAIQKMSGARVDLTNPEVTCYVEIFNKNALVYAEKIPGAGGLPSGVSEKAVALLSSGIDSPVAAWKMMKRGVRVVFVHFHSVPATSEASIRKTERIVQELTRYQFKSRLYLVPVLEIQNEIRVEAPEDLRLLLFRRIMMKLAERLAGYEKATALITGESVGQVASQTLSNIHAISAGIALPVLRPLVGEDKIEIIEVARKIATFDISIEPHEDCCTLFVPEHPETRANAQELREIEAHLNLEPLVSEAIKKTVVKKFRHPLPASAENQ